MCVFWLFCIDALGLDSHGARISVISFRRSSSCWGVWLGGLRTRNLGLEGFREGSKVQISVRCFVQVFYPNNPDCGYLVPGYHIPQDHFLVRYIDTWDIV